ncbi:diguanylate cyclase [Alicycliphilus sp. B1]|nr:diguanylate cyclase [Alicycliphilus sp. B1]
MPCAGALAAQPQVLRAAVLTSLAGTQEVTLPHVLGPADFAPEGSRVRYRLDFELPAAAVAAAEDEPLGVYVPKMSLAGRLMLNGERVGACDLGALEQLRCLHRPYLFVLPASQWRAGANTLEFEIFATSRQMNGLSSVSIGPARLLGDGPYGWRRFVQVTVANGLAWAAFCMGGIALCVSLALRGECLYGWFGATALAIALSNLNYTLTAPPVPPQFFSWFVFSVNQAMVLLLMLTVLSFFRRDLALGAARAYRVHAAGARGRVAQRQQPHRRRTVVRAFRAVRAAAGRGRHPLGMALPPQGRPVDGAVVLLGGGGQLHRLVPAHRPLGFRGHLLRHLCDTQHHRGHGRHAGQPARDGPEDGPRAHGHPGQTRGGAH